MSMFRHFTAAALAGALGLGLAWTVAAQEGHEHEDQPTPEAQSWSFSGPFGMFDRAQLQRGYQVYSSVCTTCHGMSRVAFRNLTQPGGPEFSEALAKAFAARVKIADHDDKGAVIQRPGELKDYFPSPFPNPLVAAAQYGKAPPDLSVIAKARGYERGFPTFIIDAFSGYNANTGPNYIYAFLTGFTDPPAGVESPGTGSYNKYFPGHWVAMPDILYDGLVEYQDGTPGTVQNYAKDVTAFLMWAAEPKLEERKRLGFQAMIFLVVFAGLLYFTKRKIWADVAH